MATTSETKTRRGFAVPCIKCGESDCLRIDLDDTSIISCTSCDDQFGPDEIHCLIAEWQRVLAWLESAPKLPE